MADSGPSTSSPTMTTGSNDQQSSEELLKQFVSDALILKAQGDGTKLYDQLVGEVQRLKSLVSDFSGPLAHQFDAESQANQKQLVALLRGVTRCLALVKEAHHEVLVTEIMDIKLWMVGGAVREAVLSFLCHAVAVNGAFIQGSLHVLVFSLVPMAVPVPVPVGETDVAAAQPLATSSASWMPSVEEVGVQDAVVAATKRVIELAPTAAARLLPLLVSNMPHKVREKDVHCLYLRGAFAIAEGLHNTGLGDGLIPAVVAHLIDIDVDIRWEDIVEVLTEEAREEEKGESPRAFDEQDIFDLEGMSEGEACLGMGGEGHSRAMEDRGGWEGYDGVGTGVGGPSERHADGGVGAKGAVVDVNGTNGANGANGANGTAISGATGATGVASAAHYDSHEMADKMDALMELVLAHLKRRIARGEVHQVWKSLLDAFESIILQTHRSKFTQFVVFYVASASPVYCCRSLLALLLNKLADRNQAPIVRSACAAYIGSFLARAAFVPEVTVIETFHKLADWCMRYAREEDRRGGLPPIPSGGTITLGGNAESLSRHSSFYAACQALLYALCYHMEPLCMNLGGGSGTPEPPEMMAMSFEENKFLGAPTSSSAPSGPSASSTRDKCAGSLHRLFTDVMPSLLVHPLDPLSWCAKSVVTEFARQSRYLGHDQVASLVSAWEARTANSHSNGNFKCSRPLEIFFPYDPYLLRRSAEPLDLAHTYVSWRRGHPTCIVPDDADGDARRVVDTANGHSEDNSDSDSSDTDAMGDSSDGESSAEFSSSDSDDSLRRTRFGSMPDSSMSSGGRRYFSRKKLPGALKASMLAHTAMGGSPTAGHGITIMHESPSTDGGRSPWGSYLPMSHQSNGSDRNFPSSYPKHRR